jgi:putative chitinase
MKLSNEQLKAIVPTIGSRALETIVFWLNEYAHEYGIVTPVQMAAFLAQAAHETGGFSSFRENMMYTNLLRLKEVFPKYFPTTKIAVKYAGKPSAIGNRVYANRMGNGDEASGDGYKYRGGGIFQTTGRDAYKNLSLHLYQDEKVLLDNPDMITTPNIAVQSALHYWKENNLNSFADKGDFKNLTKRINGGLNGYGDRVEYWERAKKALKIG